VSAPVDILIPSYCRPGPLAITLTALIGQTAPSFRVVVSDQTEEEDVFADPKVLTAAGVLRARGRAVELRRHLPRRGMAEQRQYLLDQATARYGLFLDDDVIVEPDLLDRLVAALEREGCGFIGSALIGLAFAGDVRPEEQAIELWDEPVRPEEVRPGSAGWERHRLHNAANLWHVQQRLGVDRDDGRLYKVAWVGGCVLYDLDKLRACGGFSFWETLPAEHAGEDVLAQLRVMERFGGAGLIPSGAYHLGVATTVEDRRVDAPWVLS
jgi:GT2 family glycosyltransferase